MSLGLNVLMPQGNHIIKIHAIHNTLYDNVLYNSK